MKQKKKMTNKKVQIKQAKETVDVFNDFCDGSIKKGKRLQITLKPRTKFNEKLAYEFCNYALGLSIQQNEKLS